MSDKTNSKNKQPYSMRGVDPSVEAKVDQLMTGQSAPSAQPKTADPPEPVGIESQSAPLLPGEKLPDFDQKVDPAPEPLRDDPIEPAKQENTEPLKDELGVEDPSTSDAVDEIVAEESNRLIAIDDAKAELSKKGLHPAGQGFFGKIKSKIGEFWADPKKRAFALSAIFLSVLVIGIVPTSRYFALNLAGVRVSTSFKVIDEKTGQPLKNVEVIIGDKSSKTDKEGQVKVEKIKLGPQDVVTKKPAFAESVRKVTFGLGSNPLGEVGLVAVGSRYTFNVTDFLSKQPVPGVEAISGEASAVANAEGEIVLVVPDEKEGNVDVQLVAEKYRTEVLSLPVGEKATQNLEIVPDRKQAFVSKRSGKYDLYKIDVDGKNEEKILEGTGSEKSEGMIILPHAEKEIVAFVSTRGSNYNRDGFALSSLNLIDLQTNETEEIAQSERIQLIDFINDKLVYVKITDGESAASLNRHKLISYDIESGQEKELASTNYFNDVLSVGGFVYYAPAAYQVNGPVGLFKVKPDGSEKNTIFGEEVWNLFRTDYEIISASVQQNWYEYNIKTSQFNKSDGAPPVLKSRVYADSIDKTKSAWVDERDGKGVLLLHNNESNEDDKILKSQSGLANPIRWLDNEHLVYRVTNSSETADYALSINGGEPHKIADVTNTAGLDRWYYY